MIQLAAHAATNHTFSEDTFRQSLRAIAQRSRATDKDIDAPSRMAGNRASPARCPTASSADRRRSNCAPSGITWPWRTQSPTPGRPGPGINGPHHDGGTAGCHLSPGRRPASPGPYSGHPAGRLHASQTRRLLIQTCEAAAEGTLEDGLVSLDEENVLEKYASHFALTQQDLSRITAAWSRPR